MASMLHETATTVSYRGALCKLAGVELQGINLSPPQRLCRLGLLISREINWLAAVLEEWEEKYMLLTCVPYRGVVDAFTTLLRTIKRHLETENSSRTMKRSGMRCWLLALLNFRWRLWKSEG
ncbi:hypothetical protein, unlikely [Trypanosoma brucei gambiense DAL972]|uniref:Uncharacterized protein n=1 Tax=Trypanosoma brucei gambiense (strain MHOM/CI/86/DAL972) TaxID=679716 RepID=C9ZJ71_TRYB9|nr:hypothetical protein, unlikely [Trypanosoma brucei gambiense DAL972]CBH09430.1 hypothetical protein, unlikely [Trypanosoma brucei gambiense DAL972]|eukprot:XP_011771735.1 hypothetical protein, unlikely [Trypanosoma brucei gambiense DAL972]